MNLLKHIWFLIFLLGFNAESTEIYIKDLSCVTYKVTLTGKEDSNYTIKDLRDNFVKLESVRIIMERLKLTPKDVGLTALGEKLEDDSPLWYPFKKEPNRGKALDNVAFILAIFPLNRNKLD